MVPPSARSSWRRAGEGGPGPAGSGCLDLLRIPRLAWRLRGPASGYQPRDRTAHQLHPSPGERACNPQAVPRGGGWLYRAGWRPGWWVLLVRYMVCPGIVVGPGSPVWCATPRECFPPGPSAARLLQLRLRGVFRVCLGSCPFGMSLALSFVWCCFSL